MIYRKAIDPKRGNIIIKIDAENVELQIRYDIVVQANIILLQICFSKALFRVVAKT